MFMATAAISTELSCAGGGDVAAGRYIVLPSDGPRMRAVGVCGLRILAKRLGRNGWDEMIAAKRSCRNERAEMSEPK